MRSKSEETGDRAEAEAKAGQPDYKWAVEWLVRKEGQRQAAKILGVNRKTVALALRRKQLTGRMNHAVQTLLANLDDPGNQEVMPLDRMASQIRLLFESVDELDRLVDGLTRRVDALEEVQTRVEPEVDVEGNAGDDLPGVLEDTEQAHSERLRSEADRSESRGGWWRR